ncbi:hypothetical protein E8E13_000895 [Curvularia kusanoi]|uniref:FAD-binding FR-type domain-containing protein n=1 Tax=Curvularia kusanoi TaxID=90978 RepID=A0A9P4TDT5_CURKU|nr:hypothetical protein E8E13_000895 [Curvularia kusanoi]
MLKKRWMLALSAWLKRHLLMPAFLGNRTVSSAGWCTIPLRLQSCTIIAFVAVNIALCVSSYEVFPGNLKRPSIPRQITRLIGRRTGVVIMANLPLMWTFAMRNNILSWASGWSFATFNSFHRWISRVVMGELIAHAIAYSLSEYYSGGLKKYDAQWPQEYWWWGVVSIIAGSIATASAAYPVRQRFYDAFLLGHIMLATMFLIGTWFHIKKQDNEFDMYFWPCVAVWTFDRALRLGRILMLNRSFGRATIAYDRASDLIHLDVPTRSVTNPQAGTYYYVYLLHGTKFWESHPFTLSSWEATTGEQGGGGQTLKFLIRPLKGFTGRLKDLAVQNIHAENGSKDQPQRFVSALVEGTYGHANSLSSYSSALIIVGGSGITVASSHLHSLNDAFNKHQHIAARRVRVVWAVRRLELASDLLQNNILPWLVESRLASRVNVTFDIFVTEPIAKGALSPLEKEPLPKSGNSNEDSRYFKGAQATVEPTSVRDGSDEPSEKATPSVQIHAGRPPLRDICLDYADRFASQGGRVALVCCGPPAMTDDVRAQAIEATSTGVDNMDFFPESFSW